MKNLKSIFFILLALFINHTIMAQSYFMETYPDVWQRATNYTLEVAEAMPAETYDFKPTEYSMTFREQLTHVVQNLSFLSGMITGNREDFFKHKRPEELTKQEVYTVLKAALGYVGKLIKETEDPVLREIIEFRGEKMPKENIFYLMRDHVAHHRAQAILYLRMNEIEAPAYRGW